MVGRVDDPPRLVVYSFFFFLFFLLFFWGDPLGLLGIHVGEGDTWGEGVNDGEEQTGSLEEADDRH
jgi:hypothetical protein